MPRICTFCYHDKGLPDHERLATFTREGHLVHMIKHLNAMAAGQTRLCPCHLDTCKVSNEMGDVPQEKHLDSIHGIEFAAQTSRTLARLWRM
ncbi:hypothetical protein FB567DRAFT_532156, partial [Paraphoma chrysanthemicola]